MKQERLLYSDSQAGSRLVREAWRWHHYQLSWMPSVLGALIRALQLRRYRRKVVCRLDSGHNFLARPDDFIQCTICINGEWEGLIYRSVRSLVHQGSIVFDVGAHVGYSSILFADWVGGTGRVHAFEPLPWHCQHIHENLRLNNLAERVQVHGLAVANRDGRATFNYSNLFNTGMGSLFARRRSSRSLSVPTVSLDSWCDRIELSNVDLVKIDVEGAELAVLDGMKEGLDKGRYRAILIELHEETLHQFGHSPREVADRLKSRYELSTWSARDRFERLAEDGPISYLLARAVIG